jgi:hypothetical protein
MAVVWILDEEGVIMRIPLLALICIICMTGTTVAQRMNGTAIPREIGNRANGFNYQPSPVEVVPREISAGVRPSKARQAATDRTLESIDRTLLRDEGLNERDAPVFTSRQ